jgi:hypothetical protein
MRCVGRPLASLANIELSGALKQHLQERRFASIMRILERCLKLTVKSTALRAVGKVRRITRHDVKEWIGASFGIVVVLPILASIGFGVLIFLAQCFNWLK